MPNLHDYLLWRGDLSFSKAPLCEADELLLAQLSYISFGTFIPTLPEYPKAVCLSEAAEKLLQADPEGKDTIHQTFYMWKENKKLLEEAAASKRFGNMKLCALLEELNDDTQFAALCMQPVRGMWVIGFRGTDDSIAGWKEDAMMALKDPVPAQLKAVDYLNSAAENIEGKIVVVGHSKGGNLAVFAASQCKESVRNRIFRVINCDGPGFSRQLIASEGYRALGDRLRVYLPQSSVVGMLLEHESNYQPIRSTALGILQHDAFSWQITGTKLLRAEKLSPYSEYMNTVIRKWLDTLDDEQRKEFVETLFDMVEALDVKTLDKLTPALLLPKLPGIIKRMNSVDRKSKEMLNREVLHLGAEAVRTLLPGRLTPAKQQDALQPPGEGV